MPKLALTFKLDYMEAMRTFCLYKILNTANVSECELCFLDTKEKKHPSNDEQGLQKSLKFVICNIKSLYIYLFHTLAFHKQAPFPSFLFSPINFLMIWKHCQWNLPESRATDQQYDHPTTLQISNRCNQGYSSLSIFDSQFINISTLLKYTACPYSW